MDKAVHQLDALSSLAETQGVGPAREDWRRQRRRMEAAEEKHTPRGVQERRHWWHSDGCWPCSAWRFDFPGFTNEGFATRSISS